MAAVEEPVPATVAEEPTATGGDSSAQQPPREREDLSNEPIDESLLIRVRPRQLLQ